MQNLVAFESSLLTSLAWSVSAMGFLKQHVQLAWAAFIFEVAPAMDSQDIANSSWADSTTQSPNNAVFRLPASTLVWTLDFFAPPGFVNTSWAFSARGFFARPLLSYIVSAAILWAHALAP